MLAVNRELPAKDGRSIRMIQCIGRGEAGFGNPLIDSASAQPRERVEVLLQLLCVGSVSSWRVEPA